MKPYDLSAYKHRAMDQLDTSREDGARQLMPGDNQGADLKKGGERVRCRLYWTKIATASTSEKGYLEAIDGLRKSDEMQVACGQPAMMMTMMTFGG
ncbi:hypothetical protein TWF106_009146 [Orbilia oligospora]|uniref:Uncharacterized protein n=1 Tax=Orbilia oligospora TaxID=2813651 RepID=A0A7C8V8M6_ORBOL|nr:hypothetical protein TWF106_009146 [Orbilia oligospora]